MPKRYRPEFKRDVVTTTVNQGLGRPQLIWARLGLALVALAGCSSGGTPPADAPDLGTGDEASAEPEPTDDDASPVTCTHAISSSQSLSTAIEELTPGDTLCLHEGTYREDVNSRVPEGTRSEPIVLRSYPGERATIHGYTTFIGADHWAISDLEFTNPGSSKPIVRILGGTGWVFEDNRIYDGDYAGLLVGRSSTAGVPHDYTIRRNVIHDTRASNLYHNPSRHSEGGLIERNLFFNSADAQNVKLGWGGSGSCDSDNIDEHGIGEVTFRYNTLYNAYQPLTIAEAGGDRPIVVHNNLIGHGTRGFLVRIDNVGGCLNADAWVYDNAGFEASRFAEDFDDQPTIMGQMHANVLGVDPDFDDLSADGFRPQNPDLQGYGHLASS